MAYALTVTDKRVLDRVVEILENANVDLPHDATMLEQVGKVAVTSGFKPTVGAFVAAAGDNPFSTLLRFIRHVAS